MNGVQSTGGGTARNEVYTGEEVLRRTYNINILYFTRGISNGRCHIFIFLFHIIDNALRAS